MFIAVDDEDNFEYIENASYSKDYYCPICLAPLVIKKGDTRLHHFAHKSVGSCSDSWERDYDISEWHRDWQNCFPVKNQEVVVQVGEIRHRADVMIGKTVIEFQHSSLKSEIFNNRNHFYHELEYKVVWLFDLSDEYSAGRISVIEGNKYRWEHPRNTFARYDIKSGNIDLFLQLSDNVVLKVEDNITGGFEEFSVVSVFTKEIFLDSFSTNGVYQIPNRPDIQRNTEFVKFCKKYGIILNPQQERAVQTVDGSILVLAVPGSGKTTVLVSRIGYMVNCKHINPKNILALTYTKAAAYDMKARYEAVFGKNEYVQFRTFNSLATAIVRKFRGELTIIDNGEKSAFFKALYKEIYPQEWPSDTDIKTAETTMAYIKNMMLSEEEIHTLLIWDKDAFPIYEKYEKHLSNIGKGDFDDQLVLAYEILKNNADALKWVQRVYTYYCVDEAQDTSKVQYEMIKLMASSSHNIFMVGDEDQSIYRFRAAYPKALLNFKDEYPNPFILNLETNYRSTSEITDGATRIISKNTKRYPKKLISFRGTGEPITLIPVKTREEQYSKVVDIAKDASSQAAFLYRDNACAVPLIDRMIKAGIPFQIKKFEDVYFFNEHVVEDIRAFFHLAMNDRDHQSFKQIYYKCKAYIRLKDANAMYYKIREGKSIFEGLREWMGNRGDGDKAVAFEYKIRPMKDMRPAEAINHIFENGYSEYLSEKGLGYGHIEILSALAQDDNTLKDFLNHLDTLKKQIVNLPDYPNANIILSTVHSSKGLEYDAVYLLDVYDGLFPGISNRGSDQDKFEQQEEERRLFYVAMTRAKNKLGLFSVANKSSTYISELFPGDGVPLKSLYQWNHDDTMIVRNTRTGAEYVLRFVDRLRFNAYSFDSETGEIGESCCNYEVNIAANDHVWQKLELTV